MRHARTNALRALTAVVMMLGLSGLSFAQGLEVGGKAPAFTLPDSKGKTVSLSDFKEKIIVMEWTNPNCPFVQRQYRDKLMTGLQAEYTKKDVVWLLVNSTNEGHGDYESGESLDATYASWGASQTALLMDSDGKVGKAYDAKTTPHMFVIDRKGTLVYQGAVDDDPRGSNTERQGYVKNALDSIISGKEIVTTTTKPYGCSVKY